MKVSVIIPTYNEEKDIGDCLKSLEHQSYKDFEIIVVDDGSKDKTVEVIKDFIKKESRIRIIRGEHKGPGFSRNLGAEKAKGKILIFIDADMTFDKDYIKNLTAPILEDKEIIGTTHDYEIATNVNNILARCWGKIRVDYRCLDNLKEKRAVIFRAIKKEKFEKMNGFDPRYGYADDQAFWFKYGVVPVIAEKTTCYHKNPETLKEVYKQSRWIGASIENPILKVNIIKHIMPLLFVLFSPIIIPFLAIRKSYQNKDFKILFPWMLLFMVARYFGTVEGIVKKLYFGVKNK